ncbi:MAG: Uma2 family endonuclease [Dehalococcoidia bacterium]
MPISEKTFKRVSLEDPDGKWELDDGCLRRKPRMTFKHNEVQSLLGRALFSQLDPNQYVVRIDAGLVRRSATRFYIPDLMVISRADAQRLFPDPDTWEVYSDPMLLVVEIWSPSTGRHDLTRKLADFKRRGDREIWLLHPIEQTLTAWRREADGTYTEAVYRGGRVQPAALPNVTVDLDEIFRLVG